MRNFTKLCILWISLLVLSLGCLQEKSQGEQETQDGLMQTSLDIQKQQSRERVIMMIFDGVQYEHLIEMVDGGELPNLDRLRQGGILTSARITGHKHTSTAPGNAELISGLGESVTKISDNSCGKNLPEGLSLFERVKKADPSIKTAIVFGKDKCYLKEGVYKNLIPILDVVRDKDDFKKGKSLISGCVNAPEISRNTRDIIGGFGDSPYLILPYFGGPDCVGHAFGENSKEYDEVLKEFDKALGEIMDEVAGEDVWILISADHGWREGEKGHTPTREDTIMIPIASNRKETFGAARDETLKQCELTPTILDIFGMDEALSDIKDLGGCGSQLQ